MTRPTSSAANRPPASPDESDVAALVIGDDRDPWDDFLVPGFHNALTALGFLSFFPVWFLLGFALSRLATLRVMVIVHGLLIAGALAVVVGSFAD